jgi:hypothetical protein
MRNQTGRPKTILTQAVLAVTLCSQIPLASCADEAGNLVPEAATIDTTPSGTPLTSTPSSETTTLHGSAKKHLKPEDMTGAATATQNPPVDLGASDNDAKLQSEAATSEPFKLHAQAVKKFDAGLTLSADEYRSLDAGCAGYESDRTFFQDIARVSVVYKDSPAEKAGIRKGDKIIDKPADNDDAARSDPTQPRQEVTCGRAGTPVDVTVLRNGKPETLTLIRMNIEDIQEPRYRHAWEQVLRQLGYPKEGSFSGTTLKNLKPTQ